MVATRMEAAAHQPETCFSIMPVNNRKKKMCPDLKVILLGNGGVGKTTLLHTMASASPINGSDFRTKMATINQNIVKLQLWDTADQEKFGAQRLPNSYYRNAHGALLVYDATNRSTFDAIVQWVTQLSAFYNGKTFGVTLVATNAENNRIVSSKEGEALATAFGAEYVECDVGSEYDGGECFNALVNALSRKAAWTVDMKSTPALFKTEIEPTKVASLELSSSSLEISTGVDPVAMADNQMEEGSVDNQMEEESNSEPMDEPTSPHSPIPESPVTQPLKTVLPIAARSRRRSVQIIDSNLTILSIISPSWKRAVYVSGCAAFVAVMVGIQLQV